MNDLPTSIDDLNDRRATEVQASHYDNVSKQIQEHEQAIETARIRIANYQQAIVSEKRAISIRKEAQRVLRRRKRVFATAKHQLQMIDEGL